MLSLLDVPEVRDERPVVDGIAIAAAPEGTNLPILLLGPGNPTQNGGLRRRGRLRHVDGHDLMARILCISEYHLDVLEDADVLHHRRRGHEEDIRAARRHLLQVEDQALLPVLCKVVVLLALIRDLPVGCITRAHLPQPDSRLVEDPVVHEPDAVGAAVVDHLLQRSSGEAQANDVHKPAVSLLRGQVIRMWILPPHLYRQFGHGSGLGREHDDVPRTESIGPAPGHSSHHIRDHSLFRDLVCQIRCIAGFNLAFHQLQHIVKLHHVRGADRESGALDRPRKVQRLLHRLQNNGLLAPHRDVSRVAQGQELVQNRFVVLRSAATWSPDPERMPEAVAQAAQAADGHGLAAAALADVEARELSIHLCIRDRHGDVRELCQVT
mmetsp:Transcript_44229/g.126630  ORF Transcript_44229/g.126630 Transcript_44229/m.126630 type:complete len:381 (+) Transcript_44229:453-1595(+)